MYIDIYFTDELRSDRDEIEDALNELSGFEVVGAGVGASGSNLDVEVDDSIPRARAISMVTEVLRQFGAHHAAYMRWRCCIERSPRSLTVRLPARSK